jgi:hypothetical protein
MSCDLQTSTGSCLNPSSPGYDFLFCFVMFSSPLRYYYSVTDLLCSLACCAKVTASRVYIIYMTLLRSGLVTSVYVTLVYSFSGWWIYERFAYAPIVKAQH